MILKDKVALVTGASSGIGRATAERLGTLGYRVAVHYGTNAAAAQAVAASIDGLAFGCDVADPAAVEAMVRDAEAALGPIDVAVANAGFYEERALADVTDELWDRSLRVLLGGCFHLARAVVPGMRARGGGSIVCLASELALIGGVGIAHYVAAKAAVISLIENVAAELGPDRIRVVGIAPGVISTPLVHRGRPERYEKQFRHQPWPDRGEPDVIADVAAFLCSDEARFITGETIAVDGGFLRT